jgi:hypothetical protein
MTTCDAYGNADGSGFNPDKLSNRNVYINFMYDRETTGCIGDPNSGVFELYGFSGDPGKNFLTSVQVGTHPVHNVSTSTYYYAGSGYAEWTWVGNKFGFQGTASPVTVTIVHN